MLQTTETKPENGEQKVAQAAPEPTRKLAVVMSKGSLDMAYPGLILANAARMTGVDAMLFFTFWGLDIVTEKKLDHLHVATVGNPSLPLPTMLGGLPGIESMVTHSMEKGMAKLDLPSVREMIEILDAAGAELYGCQMAMDMFNRKREDLVPQVKDVITAMDFIDKSEGAQVIFI